MLIQVQPFDGPHVAVNCSGESLFEDAGVFIRFLVKVFPLQSFEGPIDCVVVVSQSDFYLGFSDRATTAGENANENEIERFSFEEIHR